MIRTLGTLTIVALCAVSVHAGTAAYQVPEGKAGTQEFGGSLGMDFIVNTPIRVTSLGVFDDNSDGVNLDLGARLWSRDINGTPDDFSDDTAIAALADAMFSGADAGSLLGGSRFKAIAPLVLPPGDYTMGAWGYGAGERNGNVGTGSVASGLDDGGGAITFVGVSRFGDAAAPGSFPGSVDGGPVNRYDAGTFEYEIVPEPTAVGILGLSAFVLLILRRRR